MKCGREVPRSPCTKGGRDSPWGRGVIMEELEFVLKEGRLCWQDSQWVVGLQGRVSAVGD